MDYLEKIENNAKSIKIIIGSLVLVSSLIYGFCIFLYQSKQCTVDLNTLKLHMVKFEQEASNKHQEIEKRISQNEKNFQMTSTKLDVSLIEIRSDLQFIKEHLIRKGLDRNG